MWYVTRCDCFNDALKFRQGAALLQADSTPSAPESIVAALTYATDFPFKMGWVL